MLLRVSPDLHEVWWLLASSQQGSTAPGRPWARGCACCEHPCAAGGDVGEQCKESNAASSWVSQEGWDPLCRARAGCSRAAGALPCTGAAVGKQEPGGLCGLMGGTALGTAPEHRRPCILQWQPRACPCCSTRPALGHGHHAAPLLPRVVIPILPLSPLQHRLGRGCGCCAGLQHSCCSHHKNKAFLFFFFPAGVFWPLSHSLSGFLPCMAWSGDGLIGLQQESAWTKLHQGPSGGAHSPDMGE